MMIIDKLLKDSEDSIRVHETNSENNEKLQNDYFRLVCAMKQHSYKTKESGRRKNISVIYRLTHVVNKS